MRRPALIVALLLTCLAAFRLEELTRYSLWYDELFTLTVAQMDWGDLLRAAVADRTTPPLFYALLKLWLAIGGASLAWMRLLPCLFAIAAAWPLVLLCREYEFDTFAITATLAATAASPLLISLANEVRGYGLYLLLTTLSLLAFRRLVRPEGGRREIFVLTAVNLALVYTHYFGWLGIIAELLAAAAWHRSRLRLLAASSAITALGFAPWAVAVLNAAASRARPLNNVEWISPPGLGSTIVMYEALVARVLLPGLGWVGAVVILGVLATYGVRLTRERAHAARELLLFAVLPVAIAFVASISFARSAFVPRYLIVAAPAYLLLVGLAVARVSQPHAAVATALFTIFTLSAGVLTKQRGGEKIPWAEITAHIARRSNAATPPTESVLVITFEGFTAFPLTYYVHEHGHGELRLRAANSLSALDSVAEGWVVYREGSFTTADAPQRWLQSRGVEPTDEFRERTLSQEIVGFHFRRTPTTTSTTTAASRAATTGAVPTPSRAPSGKRPPGDGR